MGGKMEVVHCGKHYQAFSVVPIRVLIEVLPLLLAVLVAPDKHMIRIVVSNSKLTNITPGSVPPLHRDSFQPKIVAGAEVLALGTEHLQPVGLVEHEQVHAHRKRELKGD
jgi:hypothetical protein